MAGDDSGVPRNLHNIVVSIHAIATFQALHDYLRPRVSGILGPGASRVSSMMLSALAGLGALAGGSESPKAAPAESSSSASAAGTSGSALTRRRSQRLSAKKSSSSSSSTDTAAPGPSGDAVDTESVATPPPTTAGTIGSQPPPSDTLVDSEMAADFTDDEIDAEVFDEEDGDPDLSISDKTVTLSVAEGTLGVHVYILMANTAFQMGRGSRRRLQMELE